MTSAAKCLLVDLLAEQDALFEPIVSQSDEPAQARLELRHAFHKRGGVEYRKHTSSAGERLRVVAELERAGLVAVKRGSGRATHWRPTDKGDQIGRAISGRPGQSACVRLLRSLQRHVAAGDGCAHPKAGVFVMDATLAGATRLKGEDFTAAILELHDGLAFAWPRRWLASALANGRLAYALTPEGAPALAAPPPDLDLPGPEAALIERYMTGWCDAAEALDATNRKNHMSFWFQPYFLDFRTQREATNPTNTKPRKHSR